MTAKKAVGYCRVSSAEQANNSQALDNQRDRVLAAIGPDALIFQDICSGTKSKRPGFTKMLEALATGQYDSVVITRPDRLGRNYRTGFQQIIDWWVGKNGPKIRTVSLDVPIDLDQLGGRFSLALLSEAAIFEVDMLSQRIRKSKEKNMLSGDYHHKPPFGYLCVDGKFVPDEEKRHCPLGQKPEDPAAVHPGFSNADLYRLAISTYLKTRNVTQTIIQLAPYELTRCLNSLGRQTGYCQFYDNQQDPPTIFTVKPSFPPTTVGFRNYRFNCAYRGHRGHRRNWDESKRPANGEVKNNFRTRGSNDDYAIFFENMHEPLLSHKDWRAIQVLEERCIGYAPAGKSPGEPKVPGRGASHPRSLEKYPLTGLLFCSSCKRSMNTIGNTRGGYYRCRTHNCEQRTMAIRVDRAAISTAIYLQQMAQRIQAGIEELPDLNHNDQSEIVSLEATLNYLQNCPDPALVSTQIQEVRRRLERVKGESSGNNFLDGTGRQLLLSPQAADWNHWAAFIKDPSNLIYRLPMLLSRVELGYACEADKPEPRPQGARGRRHISTTGKVSVIAVTLR